MQKFARSMYKKVIVYSKLKVYKHITVIHINSETSKCAMGRLLSFINCTYTFIQQLVHYCFAP